MKAAVHEYSSMLSKLWVCDTASSIVALSIEQSVGYSIPLHSRWDAVCAAADSRCAEAEQALLEGQLSIY